MPKYGPYRRSPSPAPATAPAASAAAAAAPTASKLATTDRSRLLATRSRRYNLKGTAATERPFAGDETIYHYALIYPVKSVTDGIPTANDNALNIGRDPNFLPYSASAGDASTPVILDPGSGNVGKLEDIFVQGTAGDGFVIEWA
jgi:hypothetical protein